MEGRRLDANDGITLAWCQMCAVLSGWCVCDLCSAASHQKGGTRYGEGLFVEVGAAEQQQNVGVVFPFVKLEHLGKLTKALQVRRERQTEGKEHKSSQQGFQVRMRGLRLLQWFFFFVRLFLKQKPWELELVWYCSWTYLHDFVFKII